MIDQPPRGQVLKPDYMEGNGGEGPSLGQNDASVMVPTVSGNSNIGHDVIKPANTSNLGVIGPATIDLIKSFSTDVGSTVSQIPIKPLVDKEFICGGGAAFINITLTFPINKTIFRQQLQGISGLQAAKQLYGEGLRHLYRGFLPPLLQKTATVSIMFGSYQKFRVHLDSVFPGMPRAANHAVAAVMAGTLEASLSPFERIQTLMQDQRYQKRFSNALHAGVELRKFGVREYYRGLTPILLRNGPSNVFFFLGREFLNEQIPKVHNDTSRLARDFICGACLGALISTFFFPLNVVKTRMQSQLDGPFVSFWKSFQYVWEQRDRKVKNLFRGYHLNYTRSFISWGIINASYEYLMRLFNHVKTPSRTGGKTH